ncbi:MAG: acetolactate synthase small subunit [Gammaproteobacteria bacterium]|jgi:acetolactate synthase-1/3 small subunit|nr:acetolactate synthase small subunit [Gammaproteobacteria bacterium]|tara:strand:+ start:5272 stop:5775 length:504 start_codon:yes stop_codon:yes gene_type:complete
MTLNVNTSHRIVTALVEDKPGVLARISGMFRRRGFNIASLVVGQCELPNKSRMTFVVEGDDKTVEQVTKHLYKLIEVIKVNDISEQNIVERELALIRVKTNPQTRSEIMQIVDIFRAHIVDVANDVTIVEVTGNEHKVNSLQKLLEPFGILEVMRTGTIAMNRGLQK